MVTDLELGCGGPDVADYDMSVCGVVRERRASFQHPLTDQ